MDLYSIILENKLTLEALYTLAISLICAVIVIKTDRFFRLSLHQGIRYFRNAFFFYGVAFIARYVFGLLSDLNFEPVYIAQMIFEYFIVMAGFFLFYSLIWKKFESSKQKSFSSLFNVRILIFHLMAILIAVLDYLWGSYDFMFFSQMIIFLIACMIAAMNLGKDYGNHKFPKFYLAAMVLSLGAWALNFLAETFFNWDFSILIGISVINILFFLLFLYGVIRITKTKSNGSKET